MQASLPDPVIESLKQARRLHSFSMTLAAIFILITILGIDTPIIIFSNLEIPPEKFGLFAIFISMIESSLLHEITIRKVNIIVNILIPLFLSMLSDNDKFSVTSLL